MTVVRLICGDVGRADAEAIARRALATQEASAERELFYPYHWFLLRASWATLLGPRGGKVSCLVDARTRVVSTSDPFEVETSRALAENVLVSKVEERDAERVARRAAARAVGRRERALVPAAWTLVDRAFVHKRFWVVKAASTGGTRRLLVDGVTSRVHPLAPASA